MYVVPFLEFVAQQSKKSDIPVPINEQLRSEKNSGTSLEGFYSSQNGKRDKNLTNPNNAQYTKVRVNPRDLRRDKELMWSDILRRRLSGVL